MKKAKTTPIFQLSLTQRIAIAFTIPLITTLIIVMFAFMGFKHIQIQNRAVYQKIAQTESTQQQAEILEMLKKMEMRINFTQKQLIVISLISLILTIMLSVLIIRVIQVQYGTGIPEQNQTIDK